jgi:hypothetical protein
MAVLQRFCDHREIINPANGSGKEQFQTRGNAECALLYIAGAEFSAKASPITA